MKYTYDAKKDGVNLLKHQISLEQAAHLDWHDALIWQDRRQDYGEAKRGRRLWCR